MDNEELDNAIYDALLKLEPDMGEMDTPFYSVNWFHLMPLVDKYSLKFSIFNRGKYYLGRIVDEKNGLAPVFRGSTPQRALAECLLAILKERSG